MYNIDTGDSYRGEILSWGDVRFEAIPEPEEVLRRNREDREKKKAIMLGQMELGLANPPTLAPLPDKGWEKGNYDDGLGPLPWEEEEYIKDLKQ
jgi:hypothetical protein